MEPALGNNGDDMTQKKSTRGLMWIAAIAVTLRITPVLADDPALARVFAHHESKGTLLISRLDGKEQFIHDEKRVDVRFPSASTFKIFNALIALDSGVIKSPDEIIHWDGHIYDDFPDWNHDHTLTSAYKVSCVWCFQQLARKVGVATYEQTLTSANYGHLRKPFIVDQFWLDGSLTISAREQVNFLRQLVNRSLPFKASSYDMLRTVMLMEDTPNYQIRAKTGWAARSEPQIGWYVGYVETPADIWLFALNIDIHNKAELPKRQKVAMESLKAVGVLR